MKKMKTLYSMVPIAFVILSLMGNSSGATEDESPLRIQIREVHRAAGNGDAAALGQLAHMYLNNLSGVRRDARKAYEFAKAANEKGDAIGTYVLGVILSAGWAGETNATRGAQLQEEGRLKIRELAKAGNSDAQYYLGGFAFLDRDHTNRYNEAARWWQMASEQGHIEATVDLGTLYSMGRGVPMDDSKAFELFSCAARYGNEKAQFLLGGFFEKGYGVPANYKKAVYWYKKAADQNDADGQAKDSYQRMINALKRVETDLAPTERQSAPNE